MMQYFKQLETHILQKSAKVLALFQARLWRLICKHLTFDVFISGAGFLYDTGAFQDLSINDEIFELLNQWKNT